MKLIKFLSIISTICLVIILLDFISDKQKENQQLKAEINSLKKSLAETNTPNDGGLTILPQNAKTIHLKGFIGFIRWYQNPNFEELSLKNPADFHPIEERLQIKGGDQTLKIPVGANAVLRKNESGKTYEMKIDTHTTF